MLNKRILSLLLVLLALTPSVLADSAEPEYWLSADVNLSGAYQRIAHVVPPEGFQYLETPPLSSDPELYFVPEDEDSAVRFFYYTTGYGDARTLAANAKEAYASFYEEYEAGEITETEIGGRNVLTFPYIAGYLNEDGSAMIWEQSVICYHPLNSSAFIACIISLDFSEKEDCLDEEALNETVRTAFEAIVFADQETP